MCLGNGNPSHLECFPLPSFLHPVLYALTVLQSSYAVEHKTICVFNTVPAIKHNDCICDAEKIEGLKTCQKQDKQLNRKYFAGWRFWGFRALLAGYLNIVRKAYKCGAADLEW